MSRITKSTKVGTEFAGKPKIVSWERLWAFSGGPFRKVLNPENLSIIGGWPVKNIHTDLEFARSCGLPKVAASATQYEGYAVQLMIDIFGLEWLSNGRLDVKFPNLVDAGDIITSRAVVKARQNEKGAVKFVLDVSCDNQKGDRVVVGWAHGYVGKVPPRGLEEYKGRIAELTGDPEIKKRKAERQYPPLEYMVSPELNQQFCFGQEDYSPWYVEETAYGPPIAHPGMILNFSNATRSPGYVRGGPGKEGGVHTQDESFWYNPARVGKKLIVSWPTDFLGTYERRGRNYSISEILVVDEDGREIVRRLSRGTLAATPEQPYKKQGQR